MSSITVRNSLEGRFGPPRDQRARPTCLVFAMSDAHAAARGPWEDLSCEYLYYHAKRRDNAPPTTGAKPLFARQALEQDGQPVEAGWKYLDALPADLTQWAPPTTIGPVFRRASTLLAGGFREAWNTVEAGMPALIIMTISDAFYTPDGNGVVNADEAPDPTRRHAVVAVASGEHAGVRCLLTRNSWGEAWGLQGSAWLAEPYLEPRISLMFTMN
ncbi:MAG TPA: C1 family peptidase [Armatimonadota bacterium]|nr:C1 family peptidase [Armatimonadota bacterium]